MARDAAQGHQAEDTELEAGTPSSDLGDPSLSTDASLLEPFPSIFRLTYTLTRSRHHALSSPRGGAGHPQAARPTPLPLLWPVSFYGTEGSRGSHPRTPRALPGRKAGT